MPDFVKGGAPRQNFGKNSYLRSTVGNKFESYTVAATTMPIEVIDGYNQKVLQPGTVMAKITSGPEAGKIGPFQAAGTAEVQTITPTTVTAGTFTLTFGTQTTVPIAFNATAAVIQAALEGLSNIVPGDIAAAGGPVNTTPVTVTFFGAYTGDVAVMTVNNTGLTGTMAITTSTPGVAGAADGRQTVGNIVGVNDTFLPWQLMEGDREVGVLYIGTCVQAWCFELTAAGVRTALGNTAADAMRGAKGLDVTFK